MNRQFKIGLTLAILICTLAMPGLARSISSHSIQIEISEKGEAHVSEQYFFSFNNPREIETLRNQAQLIGADLGGWKSFEPNIFPHIGEIMPGTGKIGFEEKEGDRFVKIEYDTKKPLFTIEETSRRLTYRLDASQFSSFQTGSTYTIPTNTKIALTLPPQARFDPNQFKPQPEINDEAKRFVWSGYLNTTGNLEAEFWIEKQIAPTFGISSFLQEFLPTQEFKFILAAGLFGIGVVYFKRKTIQQKIENYLIRHSTLEKETSEKIDAG